jgi:hypothetical protein
MACIVESRACKSKGPIIHKAACGYETHTRKNEEDIEEAIERSSVYFDTYDVGRNQNSMLKYSTDVSNLD